MKKLRWLIRSDKHLREPIILILGALVGGLGHAFVTEAFLKMLVPTAIVLLLSFLALITLMTQEVLQNQEKSGEHLQAKITELLECLDPHISYFSADDQTGRDRLYDESQRIIKRAKVKLGTLPLLSTKLNTRGKALNFSLPLTTMARYHINLR